MGACVVKLALYRTCGVYEAPPFGRLYFHVRRAREGGRHVFGHEYVARVYFLTP